MSNTVKKVFKIKTIGDVVFNVVAVDIDEAIKKLHEVNKDKAEIVLVEFICYLDIE